MAKTRQGKPTQSSPQPNRNKTVGVEKAGSHPSFFLRTKLLPPRPAPELLSRTRLTERLLANLANPVTLVTANAGSGKTTLVADFLRTHKRPFVWYQLDHADADPFVFLGYVTFGIQQLVPGFGETMLSYLQETTGELAQHPERAVDVLLNEVLDRVEQQMILVLDDYHHLGLDTPVHAAVDRLLAYLPDVLHVIIVSREMPPLSLARLRTHAPNAVIDRSDLLFTDDETQELFRKVFDLELTPKQLAEYRERTHGWITALQLIRQVAHRAMTGSREEHPEPPDLAEVLRQSERNIFDYFAEEVFSDEPEEMQQLLLKMSIIDRIDLETCASLFRRNELLESLAQSGASQRFHDRGQRQTRRRVSVAPAISEFPAAAIAQRIGPGRSCGRTSTMCQSLSGTASLGTSRKTSRFG